MVDLIIFTLVALCFLSFVAALVACWHLYQSDARQSKITKYHHNVQVKRLDPQEAYRRAMR